MVLSAAADTLWYFKIIMDKQWKNIRFNRQIMKLNRPFSAAMWQMTRRYRLKKGTHRAARVGLLRLKYVEICQGVWIKALSTPFFLMVLKYLRINHEPGSRRQNRHGLQYLTFSSYNQSAISQNYSSQKEENKYSKSYKISSCNPYLPTFLPSRTFQAHAKVCSTMRSDSSAPFGVKEKIRVSTLPACHRGWASGWAQTQSGKAMKW